MKALLIRDLCSLKESRMLIVLMFLVAAAMAVWGGEEQAAFIITYVTVLSAILMLNTMGYDEMDNGYAFLFTMPFSRKKYVQAKYLFGALIGLTGWGIAVIMSLVLVRGNDSAIPGEIWMLMYVGTLMSLFLIQSVMIPVQLKFGGPKGRVAVIVLMAICFGVVAVFAQGYGEEKLFNFFVGSSTTKLCMLGLAIVILLEAISYQCSVKVMEKKEF